MRRRTRDERLALLDDYARSGMTQQAFADSRELKVGTFRSWLYGERRRDGDSPAELRFVEVDMIGGVGRPGFRVHIGELISVDFPELPPPAYLVELARLSSAC